MNGDGKTKILDVFLYLGIGISLVVSITNLLQVIFAAIDRKFFDILSSQNYIDMTYSDVRFAIASLIIMFPIYVWLSWYVAKDIEKFFYKQDLTVRKALIYCTLFVTVLSLIGTLVSVVYTYLGGELSLRFGLKATSVFGIAAATFGYYVYSLKRDYAKKSFVPAVVTLLVTVVVLASVVWSISIIGTPQEMRAKKIDSAKLSDLSSIQQEIFNRFQVTDKLPLTLSELNNAFQGYSVPKDPVTMEGYEYKVVSQPTFRMNYDTKKKEMVTEAVFEMCATFNTVRLESGMIAPPIKGGTVMADSMYSVANYYYDGDQSPYWNHQAETTCFKRVITPDMYYGR
jgi:Domain of unknown function (DUF5671)